MNHIKKIKTDINIIKYIEKLDYNELENLIHILDEYYYGKEALLSDNIYDLIRSFVNNKYPNENICKKIGYTPEDKIRLKYFMGSENKTYKTDEKLLAWYDEYNTDKLVLSAKADGISVLWDVINNRIFSRGDGKYGKDITHFIDYFNFSDNKNITHIDISNNNIEYIRGELVINKPNNRNIVAGQINRNEIDIDTASKIYFVGYEILKPRMVQYDQFKKMSDSNIRTVKYIIVDNNIVSYDYLSKIYKEFTEYLPYYIDGIIIRNNNLNPVIKSGNPPWSICFKEIDKIYTTTVKEIIWDISKKNIYIPKAVLEPITIENTIISIVPCYNAKYVIDSKINTGSVIEIIKRGGVIPMIKSIITQSEIEIILPNGIMSGVNLLFVGVNKDSEIKKIQYFFKSFGYKNINKTIIDKLYDKGYDNILKYLESDIDIEIYKKNKTYIKLLETIENIKKTPYNIIDVLSALSLDNLSKSRICSIYNKFPDFLKDIDDKDYSIINGIGSIMSTKINSVIKNNYYFIINVLKKLNVEY
ncbi:NAD-dependent DNA ligase [Choristoneura rosaceana entomopoxvirus 'L']|uniref:NAD-dependent DNA ligase n=1 Tax=Choristoneura rosaceana entomopoxvirus 'L' TaxID=1293539 RepID=A0ABM9QKN9_9POXV|nr:NAD-dependent DNA ligase [Choristoneura rosaceana entomopoxvirus 'L']CCU56100.1 NAD-dependent DNA ligase [Choristoneura rosaceana entomopoxvirus 'L']